MIFNRKKPKSLEEAMLRNAKRQKVFAGLMFLATAAIQFEMWGNGYTPSFDPRDNILCLISYSLCVKLASDAKMIKYKYTNYNNNKPN